MPTTGRYGIASKIFWVRGSGFGFGFGFGVRASGSRPAPLAVYGY